MTIRHAPGFPISPLFGLLILLLAGLCGNLASAQDAVGDDYGIWYAKGSARERGSFIWRSAPTDGKIEFCIRYDRFCEERDGFLTYFGIDADQALGRSYTIVVRSGFPNPRIEVSTFYDSLYIEDYALQLGMDVRDFAERVGLNPICDGLLTDFPIQVCDNVQMIPVGQIFAVNEFGTHELVFKPVPGDIGAYLITVSAYDFRDTGQYTINLVQND